MKQLNQTLFPTQKPKMMSAGTQIVLTIFGGVLIFTLQRFVEILYIEPLKQINTLRGEISYSLSFYANKFGKSEHVDKEIVDEASNELRKLGSELRSQVCAIIHYGLLEKLSLIEPEKNLLEASKKLIGLSNSITRDDLDLIDRRKNKIKKSLNIEY